MDIVLDPPHGVGPVRLGMSLEEAVAAVAVWGPYDVEHDEDDRSKTICTACREIRVNVLLEEPGEAVTAVELWWPGEASRTDARVLLNGDDVFTTPAADLFRRAAERGWTVERPDEEYSFVPGASLGFTRQTSQEVPRTSSGLPLRATSVLVAGTHYYDDLFKDDYF
ncbi:hypothetical protein [Streptomyces sp. NPDC003023]|uniref:hypothetical protein n=1 Tax=Streptomyces sp. NPDC003023 TaxID=3364675 RepID=UPI0036C3EDFB